MGAAAKGEETGHACCRGGRLEGVDLILGIKMEMGIEELHVQFLQEAWPAEGGRRRGGRAWGQTLQGPRAGRERRRLASSSSNCSVWGFQASVLPNRMAMLPM